MNSAPAADEHDIQTREVTPEEAQARLEKFTAELAEMVERYELHSVVVAAAIGTNTEPGAKQIVSNLFGCGRCAMATLARFVTLGLPMRLTAQFTALFGELILQRFGDEQMVAISKALDETEAQQPAEQPAADVIPFPGISKYGPH